MTINIKQKFTKFSGSIKVGSKKAIAKQKTKKLPYRTH